MTIEENLADLNAQLERALQNQASHQAQKVANEFRTNDWLRNYKGPGHSQEADVALASCAADKVQIAAQLANDAVLIKSIQDQIAAAQIALANEQAAKAQAAAEGLTGAAAEERAKALVAISETKKWVIIIAALVAAIGLIYWGWRKFKNVK